MNFLNKLYWRVFASPEKYARHIGVVIGQNCLIATRNFGTEPYLIAIGDNVQITQDVWLHTHGGSHCARVKFPDFDVFGKIKICDNAYIGSCSHIMPGVTVGDGAMIAAGSIVTKSVPPREVWGGVPARKLCSVDEWIARNQQYNLNSKKMTPDKKKAYLLSLPDEKFITK